MRSALLLGFLLVASAPALPAAPASGTAEYLDRFFSFYPTRATAAGRHDLDTSLEDLGPQRRREWVAFNR